MEWRNAGASDARLPVVGIAAWESFDIYGKEDQAARRALVADALDRGVLLFDSSPKFGEAERVLGSALLGRRERAFVSTRVWSHDVIEGHAQIDRALLYFDGRVDLYLAQDLIGWREYLAVFERMKADGSLRLSGVSHDRPAAFGDVERVIREFQIDAIQIPYNALERGAERRLLPLAAERGIAVFATRPFLRGRLLRATPPRTDLKPFEAFGCATWASVLLKWVLSDNRVTAALPEVAHTALLDAYLPAGNPPWFGPQERERVAALARNVAGSK